MNEARILFVHPSDNEACRTFLQSLGKALPGKISIRSGSLAPLLFQIRAADIAHFFLPPTKKFPRFLKKIGGKTHLIQTLLAPPADPMDYPEILFARQITVFSNSEKSMLEKHAPGVSVEVIPPSMTLPDLSSLDPPAAVRQKQNVGERMLVLALCDVSSKQHFDSFLYICRELNRREVFRFLIPRFQRDKETGLWRERLQSSIQQEKLHCASLLEDTSDLHSLIDSTDIAVLPSRHRDIDFRFFLFALEALCAGKPVLSFDVEPVSGVLRELHPQWIAQNTEDFVRIASDIRKQEANLEQFSTELARSARNRFGMEKTVARYEQLYHRLLAAL